METNQGQDLEQTLEEILDQDSWLHETPHPLGDQFHTKNPYSSLYMFLTTNPGTFMAHSPSRQEPNRRTGYGLADSQSMSAVIIWEDQPGQTTVYGYEVAGDLMAQYLDRWFRSGQPPVSELRIETSAQPTEDIAGGQWRVQEPNQHWLLSWQR